MRYFAVALALVLIAGAGANADPIRIVTASRPDYGGRAYNPALMPDLAINFKNSQVRIAIGDSEKNRSRGQYRKGGVQEAVMNFGLSPTAPAAGLKNYKPDPASDLIFWTESDFVLADSDQWEGALLDIEASYRETEVFIDGQYVGFHEGYDPFSFDLSPWLSNGEKTATGTRHRLTLRTKATPSDRKVASGKQEKFPGEGSIFYDIMVGPFQGMQIRKVKPSGYISELYSVGRMDGTLKVEAHTKGAVAEGAQLSIKVVDPETGEIVANGITHVRRGEAIATLKVPHVKLWHPDEVHSYRFEAYLDSAAGQSLDHVRSYTLFKDFEKDAFLFLNKKLFTIAGSLDQLFRPDTLYSSNPEAFRKEAVNLIQSGYNMIRAHQNTLTYTELELLETGVEVVDLVSGKKVKKGLVVSLEMPSARDLTDPKAFKQFLKELASLVKAKGWHGSTIIIIGFNETWGALNDHGVFVTTEQLIPMQRTIFKTVFDALPKFGEGESPVKVIVPKNSGWEQESPYHPDGTLKAGEDPTKTYTDVHDYFSADIPEWKYGDKTLESMQAGAAFPDPNPHHKVYLEGSGFGGVRDLAILTEWDGTSLFNPKYPNGFGYNRTPVMIGDWWNTKNELFQAFLKHMQIYRYNRVDTQTLDTRQEGNGYFDEKGDPKVEIEKYRAFNDIVKAKAQGQFHDFMKTHSDLSCTLILSGKWDGTSQPMIMPASR